MSLKQLAKDALAVQDACNLTGVVHGMSRACHSLRECLREEGPVDTQTVNTHPILQLWASKIHDLARMGLSDGPAFGAAYDACRKLAED